MSTVSSACCYSCVNWGKVVKYYKFLGVKLFFRNTYLSIHLVQDQEELCPFPDVDENRRDMLDWSPLHQRADTEK